MYELASCPKKYASIGMNGCNAKTAEIWGKNVENCAEIYLPG